VSGAQPDAATRKQLVRAARLARRRAYVPYSGFKVGAAVLTRDGTVFTGCNVENASYPLTICAERVALANAISEGHRHLVALSVVADTPRPSPCGACRQVMWELGGNLWVLMASTRGPARLARMTDLLPEPFDRSNLE
jgi:cytidine deaminase